MPAAHRDVQFATAGPFPGLPENGPRGLRSTISRGGKETCRATPRDPPGAGRRRGGDRAGGRWYLTEYTCDQEGNTATVLGAYDDKYVKRDGQWLFAERVYQILYQGPADLSGNYQPYQAG